MNARKPKVSVITATYNDRENLRRIIRQVGSQSYENIEYIIVDGGSTDGTLEVIREAKEQFGERLLWISEPDKGIYDALNKGIRMATGDILGCCFDEYSGPDVIAKMVDIMEREGTDGVHGDLYYMDGERIVRRWHQGQGRIRFGWMPGHPTLYLRKSVYDTFGLYKTDYRISADYEFMIRISEGREGASFLSAGGADLHVPRRHQHEQPGRLPGGHEGGTPGAAGKRRVALPGSRICAGP